MTWRPKDQPGNATGSTMPPSARSSDDARPVRRGLIGGVIAAVLVVAGAWFYYVRPGVAGNLPPSLPVSPGAAAGYNVVLITLDTLRADHLGCYGYAGVQTPELDSLAGEGVRFADAVAANPMTLPSHCTILTGAYAPRHGVRDNGTFRLAAKHETLAERLKAEGYTTAAFIASFVLDKRYGLDQGFDVYDDEVKRNSLAPGMRPPVPERPANAVVDSALGWLKEYRATDPGRPFFIWVHLYDPHTPYLPPEPFRTRYASNPYDGEIAFTDSQVGRLIDHLGELGLLDKTLIVAVGDHGEGLGDHGENTHSLLIYGSTMRVPMIVWGPPVIPQGLVVDDRVVGTVDVMPTILDLLGLDPPAGDGISLLRTPVASDRFLYMETLSPELNQGWSPLFALRRHRDKFIEAPTPEYYDLAADPGELNNLVAERFVAADELSERLTALISSFPPADEGTALTPDEETLRKLKALGYLGGKKSSPDGRRLDPKDMLARWERQVARATKLLADGNFRASLPLLEEAVKITPHDGSLWGMLSEAQTQARRYEEAIESRMRAIEQHPHYSDPWIQLARLHYAVGDMDSALTALAEAERLEPDNGGHCLLRAEFARAAGEYEKAIAFCEEGRRRDPVRQGTNAWAFQGKVYEEMGRLDDAAAAYRQASEADPFSPAALLGMAKVAEWDKQYHRAVELISNIQRGQTGWLSSRSVLARVYMALEQPDRAIEVTRSAIAAEPDHAPFHVTLGDYLYRAGRRSEAAESYKRALQLNPKDAGAHYSLAIIYRDEGDAQAAIRHFRQAFENDRSRHAALLALAHIHAERAELHLGWGCLKALLITGALTREEAEADAALRPLTEDPRFAEYFESPDVP